MFDMIANWDSYQILTVITMLYVGGIAGLCINRMPCIFIGICGFLGALSIFLLSVFVFNDIESHIKPVLLIPPILWVFYIKKFVEIEHVTIGDNGKKGADMANPYHQPEIVRDLAMLKTDDFIEKYDDTFVDIEPRIVYADCADLLHNDEGKVCALYMELDSGRVKVYVQADCLRDTFMKAAITRKGDAESMSDNAVMRAIQGQKIRLIGKWCYVYRTFRFVSYSIASTVTIEK